MNHFLNMIGHKTVLSIVLALFSFQFNFAQNSDVNYVKIIIPELENREQSSQIDSLIRTKSGIIMVRTDRHLKMLYSFYAAESGITINDYRQWINELGFNTSCYVVHLLDDSPIIDLRKESCIDLELDKKTGYE